MKEDFKDFEGTKKRLWKFKGFQGFSRRIRTLYVHKVEVQNEFQVKMVSVA